MKTDKEGERKGRSKDNFKASFCMHVQTYSKKFTYKFQNFKSFV